MLESVDLSDVRMVERSEHLCLALEAREPIAVAREMLRQHLDGDIALQLRIAGAIDLAHAAGTERRDDFVRAKAGPGRERHLL